MLKPFRELTVGGIPFQVSDLERAADWLVATAVDRTAEAQSVRLANAYCVALASKQFQYGQLLATSGVNFPDGVPVVAVMRALNQLPFRPRRVRGPSFFRQALQRGMEHGVRHFFLGSTPETLTALERAILDEYPGVQIAGFYSPPFRELDDAYLDDLVERAAAWDADVVWVGMGTPKQDFVAHAIAERAGITAVGVGAGFDFVAGTVREAPRWVQRNGLEWLYRFMREPRRLWQRYVFGNSRFLALVTPQVLAGTPSMLLRWRRLESDR